VPHPLKNEQLHAYKVSKRQEDDISTICLVLRCHTHPDALSDVRIGVGGVAATPVRARRTEAVMQGQPWDAATLALAQNSLSEEFKPITDMRASAHYRQLLLRNLLQRAWLQAQGVAHTSLEDF
jgi:xanthine dehydrogenase small subunit